MLQLLKVLDKATGYIFVPDPATRSANGGGATAEDLFSSISGPIPGARDVGTVQERWIDNREAFDEWEREGWKVEGEMARRVGGTSGQHGGGREM